MMALYTYLSSGGVSSVVVNQYIETFSDSRVRLALKSLFNMVALGSTSASTFSYINAVKDDRLRRVLLAMYESLKIDLTLNLDFINSNTLDPRITFTRASGNATFTGSDGLLKTSLYNLLLNSKNQQGAGWTAGSFQPIGSDNLLKPNAINTPHNQAQTITTAAGQVTFSFELRPAGYTRFGFREGTISGNYLVVDCVGAGTILQSNLVTSSSISLISTGSYRITVEIPVTAAAHQFSFFIIDNGYTTGSPHGYNYVGDTVSGMYLDAAGLFEGTYTAAQILAQGGIPLTTTVANGNPRFDYDPATPAGTTGVELVANGGPFSNTTGWTTFNTTLSASSGKLIGTSTVSGANAIQVLYAFSTEVGKTYSINGMFSQIVSNSTSAISILALNSAFGTIGTIAATAGVPKSYQFVATTTTSYIDFRVDGNFTSDVSFLSIDNISVKEVTFAPKGLLIEESRTNLLLQSRDMTQAVWSKTDVTPLRNQVGIDGVANSACLMTEGSAGTAITTQIGAALTAGSTISTTKIVKRGNVDWFRIVLRDSTLSDGASAWFNLGTGVKGSAVVIGLGTAVSSTMTSLGGGWYKCVVSCVPNGSYTQGAISFLSSTADNSAVRVSGATYILDCAQLEVGASASSYIPTAASTVTRSADNASMTGTNFSSWFSATQGTFVVEGDSLSVGGRSFTVSDGTINNQIFSAYNIASGALQVYTAGVFQAQIGTTGDKNKIASAFATNDFAVSVSGAAVNTDTSGSVATYSQINFGTTYNASVAFLNGHIKSLRYYNTRLPNSVLQSLTT